MSIGFTGTWFSTAPLPNPSNAHHCAVHDNKIYVVGGNTPTSGIRYDRVLYGSVQPDGHIDPDSWQYTTPLPEERVNAPAVVYEDWIYVLDGSANSPGWIERDTAWYASFNPDGTIGDWAETTRLPYRGPEEAVQWNGRIYIMAGWTGFAERDDVWYAEINPTDGSLSSWTKTTSLPRQICHGHATVVHNGVIYFIGGHEEYPKHYAREVYYSIIQETGEVAPWIETAPLPVALDNHDAVVYGDDLFVIGGQVPGSGYSDVVYKAHINPDGSLNSWEEYCVLPEPLGGVGSVVLNGRIYVIGGYCEVSGLVDTVYFTSLFPAMLSASVDIKPDTLNLRSRGKWVTGYIELPEGYSVSDINVSTILLNDTIPADIEAPIAIGDYDDDGIPDLMVKFDRAEVTSYILANVNMTKLFEERFMTITLTITGYLNDGTPFQGGDTNKVIYRTRGGPGRDILHI